jgi:O-methyltransferase
MTQSALLRVIAKSLQPFGYKLVRRSSTGALPQRILSQALHLFGSTLVQQSAKWGAFPYEYIHPLARYAPWNADPIFLATYAQIADATFVDMYRCYELWTLVEQTAKLSGKLIQIGVWRGGTGALIARKVSLCGIDETVYLCDTFTGIVKAGPNDPVFRNGDLATTSLHQVEQLVHGRMQLENVIILPGIFPDQTAAMLADQQFRFCHIDVDVYQSAKEIGEWIWSRMVVGGIVIYDDYGFKGCAGVTAWVEEQRARADRLLIHNLNGHAIVVKLR